MTDVVRGGQIPGNPVHIVFDPREPCRRMISRFVEGGRLINVKFFEGVGTKPRDTYNSLKAEGRIRQAVDIDANGPPGVLSAREGADTDLARAILGRTTRAGERE
jgi:hypothetical protein